VAATVTDEKTNQPKPLVSTEDLSARVDELLEWATERHEPARESRPSGRRAGPVRTRRADKPDITHLLRDELMSLLEDEVVPVVEPDPERGGIQDWELQREVAKKALIGLKVERLRRLAEEMQLDKRGKSEDVADRIARAYRYDEQEIAKLILENEDEPEPERGHIDRIFPLAREIDAADVAKRLSPLLGRYIRVGVARWFVFEDLSRGPNGLKVRGTLRTYKTFVTSEDTAIPRINATPTESAVEMEIADHASSLLIKGAGAPPSRAAAKALDVATGQHLLGNLPFVSTSFEGPLGSFARSTVFMLDFVENRLSKVGVHDRNLTVARFEIEREDRVSRRVEEDRPTLREVRFEGDHLLDSVQACRLIALEGRALIDLSLRVSVDDPNTDSARFPIRVSLDRDHALIVTGFGSFSPEKSVELHRRVVQAVEGGLQEGVVNVGHLESFARRIDELARSDHDVEHATMLRDEPIDETAGGAEQD
jgi:hypothetical protein